MSGNNSWKLLSGTFAAVLIFLFLCEAGLRLTSIGASGPLFEKHGGPDGNPVWETSRWARKKGFVKTTFAVKKRRGTKRVFIFGGSSAHGIAWAPKGTPSKWLELLLSREKTGFRFEVVNMAIPSADIYFINQITGDFKKYDPDFIVLYSGNNELIEHKPRMRSDVPGFVGFVLRSRIIGGIRQAIKLINFQRFVEENSWAGDEDRWLNEIKLVTQADIDNCVEMFRRNLCEIRKRAIQDGSRLIALTVPSNLKDWAPNRSGPGEPMSVRERGRLKTRLEEGKRLLESDASAAENVFLALADIHPAVAETHYWIGRAAFLRGDFDKALESFMKARDLDDRPGRALSAINDVIRKAGENRDMVLVDAERIFNAESEGGVAGYDLFDDYCHPNLKGQYIIAAAVRDSILRDLDCREDESYTDAFNRAEFETGIEALGITDRYRVGKIFYLGLCRGFNHNRPRRKRAFDVIREASDTLPGYKHILLTAGLMALAEENTEAAESYFDEAFSEGSDKIDSFIQSYFPDNLLWNNPVFYADGSKLRSLIHINYGSRKKKRKPSLKLKPVIWSEVDWGRRKRVYYLSPEGSLNDITETVVERLSRNLTPFPKSISTSTNDP